MKFAKQRQLVFVMALLAAPAAMAQSSPPPAEQPSATQPSAPSMTPSTPSVTERAKPTTSALLGMDVFSADQTRLGKVEKVVSGADGKTTAIQIKTGGFLGFGGKMVSIPDSKFTLRGTSIQSQLTAEEVSKLPEVKDQS